MFSALLLAAAPAALAQSDEALQRAVVSQEISPELQARAIASAVRVEAREQFIADKITFTQAFPQLVDANLWEPGVLEGRLLALDADGVARILERDRLLAAHGDVAGLAETLLATHRAEAQADTLERELLQAALARRSAYPVLAEPLPDPEPLEDDASDEAIARAAAAADASHARWRAAVRSILVSAIRPTTLSAPDATLQTRRDAHTLALWLPFVSEQEEAERTQDLVTWWSAWADQAIENDSVPASWTSEEVDAAREEVSAALASTDAASNGPRDLATRRVAQARLVQLEARAVVLRAQGTEKQDASLSLRVAQEDAQASKALAEQAQRSAEDEVSRTRAEVLALRARSEQDRAERWAQVEREQEVNAQSREAAAALLADLSARVVSIEERHRLDPTRADPEAVYQEIMEHRTDWMRGGVFVGAGVYEEAQRHTETMTMLAEERLKLQGFRQAVGALADVELSEALDAWALGIEDGLIASETSLASSVERYSDVSRDVRGLHSLRRRLTPYVSLTTRRAESDGLLEAVVLEGRHWLVSLQIGWAPRLEQLRTLPQEMVKMDVLGRVLWTVFWTGSLLLVWIFARTKTDELSSWLSDRVCASRPALDAADARALAGPMHRALKAAVDLFLGWALVGPLGEVAFEVSFLLMIYLQFALYRVVVALFDLLVVRPEALRPALLTLRKGYWSLVRQTVRYVAMYWIGWRFLSFFLWDLGGLDRTEQLISTAFGFGVFLGMIALMYVWAPTLQEMLRTRRAAGWLAEWATQKRDTAPSRLAVGVTAFGLLLWLLLSDLVDWLTRTQLGAQWVANVVGRYRLQPGRGERASLPAEQILRLTVRRPPAPEAVLVRPEWVAALHDMLRRGTSGEGRQVVLAHAGAGGGKRTACDVAARWADEQALPSVRIRLCTGSHTAQGLVRVLSDAMALDDCATLEALQNALHDRKPTVFILEDLDRVFRRVVGGFETFRRLMDVVQATSDRHHWVLTIHRPAYAYLTALGPMVDVAFLPAIVALAPLSVEELRQKVLERTQEAALQVDFSDLVRRGSVASDVGVEQERAERSFFRLLRDASGGNLHVALHLWARSLEPDPSRSGWAKVFAGDALHPDISATLSDLSWFVLNALWIQPRLTADDLSASLNLSIADVHRALQELEAHGIVEAVGDSFGLRVISIPAVERSLRRRNLLHLG